MDDAQAENKPLRASDRGGRGGVLRGVNLSWPLGETERAAFQTQGRNQILNPERSALRVTLEDRKLASLASRSIFRSRDESTSRRSARGSGIAGVNWA